MHVYLRTGVCSEVYLRVRVSLTDVYLCIHTCIEDAYIYIYIYIHIHIYTYNKHTHPLNSLSACMCYDVIAYTCVYVYAHACIYVFIHIFIYLFVHIF
jgi:hypothetical protein